MDSFMIKTYYLETILLSYQHGNDLHKYLLLVLQALKPNQVASGYISQIDYVSDLYGECPENNDLSDRRQLQCNRSIACEMSAWFTSCSSHCFNLVIQNVLQAWKTRLGLTNMTMYSFTHLVQPINLENMHHFSVKTLTLLIDRLSEQRSFET